MTDFLNQFHFIRPYWLWAVLPLLVVGTMVFRQQSANSSWTRIIDSELLPFLTENAAQQSSRRYLLPLATGWLLAVLALAGPTWQKIPQPVHRQSDAVVLVLDLSISMLAADLEPSRLIQARRKLIDILKIRKEGLTGLVVFSGDAHSVSPLTDDSNTIAALVPALSPEIMPVFGSNLAAGLKQADRLLQQGGAARDSRIIVLTDGVHPSSFERTLEQAETSDHPISILAVGTRQGAPIPKPDGGFLQNGAGSIVIPKLEIQPLTEIAQASGGKLQELTIDDTDINMLLSTGVGLDSAFTETQPNRQKTRELERWVEQGPWLILPLLLLVVPAFRKGWIFALLLIINLPQPAMALEWQDLWKTPDQQGLEAMKNQHHGQAAELFDNPQWKGSARFRKGDYEKAAEHFSTHDTPTAHYNRGNALAKAGKLEEAIEAFDQALKGDPQLTDAASNKKLVEELLERQQQQNDRQQSDSSKNRDPSDSQQQSQNDQPSGQENEPGQQGEKQPHEPQQNPQNPSGEPPQGQQNESSEPSDEDRSNEEQERNSGQQEQRSEELSKPADQQNKQNSDSDPRQSSLPNAELSAEQLQQDQKTEQMLRRLPDNPGLLFQRKFQQQYLNHQQSRNRQSATNNQEPMW